MAVGCDACVLATLAAPGADATATVVAGAPLAIPVAVTLLAGTAAVVVMFEVATAADLAG
ncbi:hypothetical protein [Xylella fastidiosa]|uniref:hypothetical protein n=1 Tax=Xylella fastidiosa TaxID=2371 RepID=UPI0012AEB052|nr:hypothetical protein [Xylella fastidiosa]WLE28526.1 hypothetical protein DVS74_011700 [Xylella fastidiosa subsp. multiplex]